MKRFKPPKNRQFSKKEVEEIGREISRQATHTSFALMFLAINDTLKLPEEDAVKVLQRVERYAGYVDEKLIEAEEALAILEKNTGLKFKI